jgi:type IV pilus assembly protein PilY1
VTWSNGKTVESLADIGSTGAGSSSFAGDLIASDYDLNGLAESLYFGSTKGSASPFGGSLWAIDFNGSADPGDWLPRQVVSGLDKPVTIRPTLGVNARQQHMVFFGTGRVFTKADLSDKNRQAIVGLVDEGDTIDYAKLLDETNVTVDSEGNVSGAGSITTVPGLEAAGVASCAPASDGSVATTCGGWKFQLEVPKDSSNASLPAERVISTQVLSGGVLTTTTYLPGTDLCTDQGEGRLYPMNYQSGTGDPGLAGLLGTTGTDGTLNKYVKLGKGLPSQPSLHKGGTGESGDQQLRVCVQTSSGAIICQDLPPLKGVNSGEISWREPVDK